MVNMLFIVQLEIGATDVLDYLVQVCGCDLSVVGGKFDRNIFHIFC